MSAVTPKRSGQEPVPAAPNSRVACRALVLVRVAWALILLFAPPGVLRALRAPSAGRGTKIVRILGVRHLLQAVVQAGGSGHYRGGALIDLLHGVSMLLFAVVDSSRRRAAFLDAVVAGGLFAWERASLSYPATLEYEGDAFCQVGLQPSPA